ncbi:hypothetical protein BDV28DRAFT_148994 [Aspergillus coremiiformis]|uniref:Uncharacterized protein n=1 Tax=Aspergillus coremiiformis TaxID=138285 RepID=A0A5N6Z5S3_9EURO|nr:hypothetical protein BDV28DRAFT_148994 [Aspergillus coremiiformis]
MTCPKTLNCSPQEDHQLSAYPDVAGIGMIITFFVSAWLTFLVIAVTLCFIEEFPKELTNDVDQFIIHFTRRPKPHIPRPFRQRRDPISLEVMQRATMTLSDHQLITGASIFIVAYAKHCEISQYHFYIAFLLGTTSFVTHQSRFMATGYVLQKIGPFPRYWRFIWTFAIFTFVLAGNTIVYNDSFLDIYGLPTQCAWKNFPQQYGNRSMLLLVVSSCVTVWGLGSVTRNLCPDLLQCLGRLLQPLLPWDLSQAGPVSLGRLYDWIAQREKTTKARILENLFWWMAERFLYILTMTCWVWSQILGSMFIDLYRILIFLVFLTRKIVLVRKKAASLMEENENTWEFGQIMPVILLALPIFQVMEMLFGKLGPIRDRETILMVKEDYRRNQTRRSDTNQIESKSTESVPVSQGLVRQNPPSIEQPAATEEILEERPEGPKEPDAPHGSQSQCRDPEMGLHSNEDRRSLKGRLTNLGSSASQTEGGSQTRGKPPSFFWIVFGFWTFPLLGLLLFVFTQDF